MSKIEEMKNFVEKTIKVKANYAKSEFYPCNPKTIQKLSKILNDRLINKNTLVAVVDTTLSQNKKRGIVFTTYGFYIYIGLFTKDIKFIKYSDLERINVKSNNGDLIFHLINGETITTSYLTIEFSNTSIYSIITNLCNIDKKYDSETVFKKSGNNCGKVYKSAYDKGYNDGFMDAGKQFEKKFNNLKNEYEKKLKEKSYLIEEYSRILKENENNNIDLIITKEELERKLNELIKEYKELEKKYNELKGVN